MPEVKPRDYTAGELTSAADVCRDAVDLLTPTADELMRISAEVELVEEELHFARTSRHLNSAALHLKLSEATIRRIAKNVGRTVDRLSSRLFLIAWIASMTGSTLLLSDHVLPGNVADFLKYHAGLCFGFSLGMTTANLILVRRTRRPHRDP